MAYLPWKEFAERIARPVPAAIVLTLADLATGYPVLAEERNFNIAPQPLNEALIDFATQAGVSVNANPDLLSGQQSQGVSGRQTIDEALASLLQGTGLTAKEIAPNTYTVQPASIPIPPGSPRSDTSKPVKVPEVIVKDVLERPTWTTPVDGYKADHASTVTRSTMSIDETPTSIGVVTRDMIRDTFSRSQGDAFEGVSGVSRSNTRMGRSEGLSIRGFDVNTLGGSFNGLKANGLPTDGVWAPDWGIVERYEIVKGPASIVGGAANPGGIINRITKTPQRSNFTTVEANFGSYDFYRGLIDANGVLPKHEHIRGRLVFAVEEGGNFIDFTPTRQYTVAPSVEFDLFKGAGKLLLVGTYQTFEGASYPGYPFTSDGKMLNIAPTHNFGGGAPNGARTNYTGYNGEVHYDHKFLHDIKLSVKGKYSNSDLFDKSLYSYIPYGAPPSGDSTVGASFRRSRFDTYAGELTLSKEFTLLGQKHEVLAGADYRDMKVHQNVGFAFLPIGGAPFIDNIFNPQNLLRAPEDSVLDATANKFSQSLRQTGAFGQAVLRPFERLTLVAAGRHDQATSTLQFQPDPEQNEQTKNAWTGRFGATYKVVSWMNVYGGLQQSFVPQVGVRTRDGNPIDPETGINYEVGAKLSFLEERLRFTTALFRTYRRNVATLDTSGPGFFSVPIGEQRNQGVELDVNGQPIPGLNLFANVTFLDAEITKDNNPALLGARPVRNPDYFGRVFATYQLQTGPLQGFGFGGGVYYQSGTELSFPNRIGTQSYQRVDMVLFYRGNKNYDVSFNIRNLLNEKYIESPGSDSFGNGFGSPITAIGTVRMYF